MVTVGSQQALDLISRIFLDPGDVVLAEGPSYVGALGTFAAAEAEVVHVPLDGQGLIPAALSDALDRLAAAGRKAKFLYLVPNFHNPAGVTLAVSRRAEILELCERHDVLVIEDNPYGLLGFDGQTLPALRSMAPERVVYLGSFSKTFASGVRVGWAYAPPAIRDKLVLLSESQVLCPPMLSQLAVAEYLDTQPWREQIKVFRELYRERRDAMLDALSALMPPGCTWTHPEGGFYVWLTLPPGLDAKVMQPRGSPSGSRTCRASASTRTARAGGRCGCRTATPAGAHPRGCADWPAWWSRSWSCGRPSGRTVPSRARGESRGSAPGPELA